KFQALFIYRNWARSSEPKSLIRNGAKRRTTVYLSMGIRSGRVLKSETGNLAIITDPWDYLLGNSRSCFSAHGFQEVTEQAGRWLSSSRRLSGWPHFPFPANLPLVDVLRK